MKTYLTIAGKQYVADLEHPLDISIPLDPKQEGPNAFYAPSFSVEPVISGSFIGDTRQGGGVNFKNIRLNPHGNGTHTECVGHITKEAHQIIHCLRTFHFAATLITLYPQLLDSGDKVITRQQLEESLHIPLMPALILRTQPNHEDKKRRHWSGTNPPYLTGEASEFLREMGVKHLLLDLPSVDREEDEGRLAAHKAFWGLHQALRPDATITEMIYVPDEVKDGLYLLNLQVISIVLDVSPSKPVLYALEACS